MSGFRIPLAIFAVSLMARGADEGTIRERATKSVALLQKVTAKWRTPCVSCHHQVMPAMALEAARSRGLRVDENAARDASARGFKRLADFDGALQVHELIDPAVSEGNLLLGAHAAGIGPSQSTAAYARHIARNQRDDGSWLTFDSRPPHSGATLIAPTAVAARAIALYLPDRVQEERRKRVERARKWLLGAKSDSTDDAAHRLLGLYWTGASKEERAPSVRELLALQRADGGWGQVPAMKESDAFSTAEALVALSRTYSVPRTNPDFRRGVDWLIRTQAADGSWQVKSRIHTPAPVSPPYFESGFPYGHDQWLSCAATAWSVIALAEALDPVRTPPVPLAVPGVRPEPQPWIETAMFGTAAEMETIDPKAATAEGTSALMIAADDAAKVRVLLKRGAKAGAVAKSGYDALMVAGLFRGNRETLELLLKAGASPKARAEVKYKASALPIAAYTGDAAMVSILLDHGADVDHPMKLLGDFLANPLVIAVSMDDGALVRLLGKRGSRMQQLDEFQMNQVSWAALGHKDSALAALLEAGVKRDQKDKFGLTPLEHTKGIAFLPESTERLLRAR